MNDRFRFRVWGVDYQQYMNDGEFVIDNNGELCAPHADMLKVPQTSFIIEQCTGRHDIHGKLIYEGDVVKVQYSLFNGLRDARNEFVGSIKWEDYGFVAEDRSGARLYLNLYYIDCRRGIEVLGNIHENPEMMEG